MLCQASQSYVKKRGELAGKLFKKKAWRRFFYLVFWRGG